MRLTARLINAQQAYAWWGANWPSIKAWLMAGHRLRITIAPETRSTEQNAMLHSIFADFARSGIQFHGKPRTEEQWKVLLISGHSVATKQGAEMLPGIEGEYVNIRESSAQMSVARMTSLIDYAHAFGNTVGVQFSRTSLGRDWPEEMI